MEIKGKIKKINDTQNVTDSFKKREFVVTTQEQYPQDIILEFTQDKCDVLSAYGIGQDVEVHFNLRGRSFTDRNGVERTFNTLQAWKIITISSSSQPTQDIEQGDDDLPW